MKVLLVAADRCDDPNSWSGAPYKILQALVASGHEVRTLTGLSTTRAPWHLLARVLLGKDRYLLWMTAPALRKMSRRLEQAQAEADVDITLCVAAQFLTYAAPTRPSVLLSDAPWSAFRSAYRPFTLNFSVRSRFYERRDWHAMRRIDAVVYSSRWAFDRLDVDYGVHVPERHVVPLGANWEPQDFSPPSAPDRASCRLLFVGRDWERKGGPLALRVLAALQSLGVDAVLDVVGARAEDVRLPTGLDASRVVVHGSTAIGGVDLRPLFQRASFVLVPSRAECFGIIFAEAAAFGLPAVALSVDAVPEVVEHEVTGLLFPDGTTAREIADRIIALLDDPVAYEQMSAAARSRYEEQLNWRRFADGLDRALRTTAARINSTASGTPEE